MGIEESPFDIRSTFSWLRNSIRSETTNKRNLITVILLCTGLALLPFGDLQPLRVLGGGYLASPAGLIIAAAWLSWNSKPLIIRRTYFYSIIVVCLILGFSLFISSGKTYFYGQLGSAKDLKMAISLATEISVFFAGLVLGRKFTASFILGLSIALILSVVMGVFTLAGWNFFDGGSFFHSWDNSQGRVRAAQGEASYYAASLILLGGALAVLAKTRRVRLILLVLTVVLPTLLTASRGAFVSLAVALVGFGAIWAFRRFVRPRRLVAWAIVLGGLTALMAVFLPLVTSSKLWLVLGLADTNYTSDATRSAWAIATLLVLFTSPLGLGLANSVVQSQHLLAHAQTLLYGYFSEAQWAEVINLIHTNIDDQLAPKSLVTTITFLLGFGGFGVISFIYSRIYITQGILEPSSWDSTLLKIFAIWVMVLAAVSYGSLFSWDLALVLGLLASKKRDYQCE